jgi:hypothetical protein
MFICQCNLNTIEKSESMINHNVDRKKEQHMSKIILFTVTYCMYRTYCTHCTVLNERSKIQFRMIENTIKINTSFIKHQTQE